MTQMEKPLDQVLLERGMVSPYELRPAVEEERSTGKSLWQVLLDRGVLGERDLTLARAAQLGMDFVDPGAVEPTPEAIAALPEEIARAQSVLPLRVENGVIHVAVLEREEEESLREISRATGKQVAPALSPPADLRAALDRVYASPAQPAPPSAARPDSLPPEVESPFGPAPGGASGPVAAPFLTPATVYSGQASAGRLTSEDVPMVEAAAPGQPVAEPIQEGDGEPNLGKFLMAVIEEEGSDLHLTSGLPPMIRVDGELRPVKGFRALQPKDLQEIIYSMITQRQRETFEDNLELDVSYALPGQARFRVNVFQQRDAIGAVMRLIPYEIKALDDLGLPPTVGEFARLRRGLVLVTGVTGSGKSTTLAALIDVINSTRAEHIMTVEDPIEFLHKHKKAVVNQREVGTDTYGFANALKHVLRQDPDVILVGEMRDLETISTALTAAETGHLVFGTLHTQDAPQSVDRVIDVFPPHQQEQIRIQLAGTIVGILSQQLVPRSDRKGRVVAVEILVATPAVRNLIREGKTHQIYTSMQAGGKFGMQVMDQHLAELVKQGRVTYEAALERSHHLEEFNRLVGKA